MTEEMDIDDEFEDYLWFLPIIFIFAILYAMNMSGLDANSVLTIGVSIIIAIWICFSPILLYLLKKEKEKKGKHTKSLNEDLFRKWVEVTYSTSKFSFSSKLSGFNDFKNGEKFNQAKQHLQSKKTYKENIWIYWDRIEKLIIEYSEDQKSLEDTIKQLLHEKITKTLPDIERKTWETRTEKSYIEDHITDQIWADANQLMENPDWTNPELKIVGDKMINREDTRVMLYPNLSNHKRNTLDQQFNHIIKRKAIQNEVRKLKNIEEEIDNNLKTFKSNLNRLILRLNDGEILEGKCDGCPK